jgi:protein TonB
MTADDSPIGELTAAHQRSEPAQAGNGMRWVLCIVFAIAFHAAAFAAMLAPWPRDSDDIDGAPAILVELAQVTAAPAAQPVEVAPGPQRPDAQAAPDNSAKPPETQSAEQPPVIAAATASDPIVAAATKVEPAKTSSPPEPAQTPHLADARLRIASRASVSSAPSAAAQQARASAPAPGAGWRDDNALPNWKSQLLAVLERNKRYPPGAQSQGDQGVATLAFNVDRRGGVHRAHIARSSGSAALDRETLSLLQRAQPLPAPPAEMRGAQIAVMVPIRYSIR